MSRGSLAPRVHAEAPQRVVIVQIVLNLLRDCAAAAAEAVTRSSAGNWSAECRCDRRSDAPVDHRLARRDEIAAHAAEHHVERLLLRHVLKFEGDRPVLAHARR